jgi:hypothetical protein
MPAKVTKNFIVARFAQMAPFMDRSQYGGQWQSSDAVIHPQYLIGRFHRGLWGILSRLDNFRSLARWIVW